MPEEMNDAGPSAPAYDPAEAERKIKQLSDTVGRLVDEKAALTEANTRLADQLKAVIAEKGELQQAILRMKAQSDDLRRQLALKEGLGVHENRPEVFGELKKGQQS